MKKILVPVDFSKYSEYALEVAAQLARKQNSEIVLFHMVGVSKSVLSKSEAQEREEALYYLKMAKQKTQAFLDKPYLHDLKVHTIIQNYKVFQEINTVAKEQQADLIVMGSHGTSGLRDFFVGSNTEKVVRSADIPILVIKKRQDDFELKTIVFAIGLKPENSSAYKTIKQFSESFSAKLHLVYINTIDINFLSHSEINRKKELLFQDFEEKPNLEVFEDTNIEEGIFNYAKLMKADMVAIPTHGRSGLAHFFAGSLGENVANNADLPVMTIKI